MTDDGVTLPPPFVLAARERVGSTNDEAKRLASSGAGAFTVVWAREQTGGRGRRGRTWFSPPGNLYCSVLLDGGPVPAVAAQLSFVAAVAVAEALSDFGPREAVSVKWPNDILCGGRKICGMLLEQADPWIVLGVGVNVAQAPEATTLYPTTSLAENGVTAGVSDVLAGFCKTLLKWTGIWREEGFSPVRRAWTDHAAGLGRTAQARLADGTTVEGLLYGLDAEGGLLLDTPGGGRRRILAGDIFFPP